MGCFIVDPGCCMLGDGASMDQTCSSTFYRCLFRLGSGESGGLVNSLDPLLLFLSSVCTCQGTPTCWGQGPLPSGSVAVMGGCTWPTTVFGWVVPVKLCSHECQHQRFPSRTSRCDGMINVINVTCQWFWCCGWSVWLHIQSPLETYSSYLKIRNWVQKSGKTWKNTK